MASDRRSGTGRREQTEHRPPGHQGGTGEQDPPELGQLTGLRYLSIDGDTGLCILPQIQDTAFGRLAIDQNGVPLCGAVPTLPALAAWGLALALLLLGLHLMSGNPGRPAVVVTE